MISTKFPENEFNSLDILHFFKVRFLTRFKKSMAVDINFNTINFHNNDKVKPILLVMFHLYIYDSYSAFIVSICFV